jgi:hypothetical protein
MAAGMSASKNQAGDGERAAAKPPFFCASAARTAFSVLALCAQVWYSTGRTASGTKVRISPAADPFSSPV